MELTQKTVELLAKQIELTVLTNRANAQHQLLDAHWNLHSSILENEKLLEIYTAQSSKGEKAVTTQMLATFLINHCLRIFIAFENSVLDSSQFDSFAADARDMFQMEFLRRRWEQVKEYHPASFRKFVDEQLLKPDAPFYLDLRPRQTPVPVKSK